MKNSFLFLLFLKDALNLLFNVEKGVQWLIIISYNRVKLEENF